jgi:hypothetical protein
MPHSVRTGGRRCCSTSQGQTPPTGDWSRTAISPATGLARFHGDCLGAGSLSATQDNRFCVCALGITADHRAPPPRPRRRGPRRRGPRRPGPRRPGRRPEDAAAELKPWVVIISCLPLYCWHG